MTNLNDDILESDIGMYTNLHAHDVYSVLDGFSKTEDYVLRCKAMGMRRLLYNKSWKCIWTL